MRKPSVTIDEIIKSGEELEAENIAITEYSLSQRVGKGRPKRLFDEWNKYVSTRPASKLITLSSDDIHVLEPEVESLLDNLVNNMNQQLKEIIVSCDKKLKLMADKKVEVASDKFDIEMQELIKTCDVREEFVDDLEQENEKLIDELDSLNLLKAQQFEYEKTFIKLRSRLQSKSDLLNERQLRIDELVKLNHLLEENANTTQ